MPVLPAEEIERLSATEAAERQKRVRAGIGKLRGRPCHRAQRREDDGSSGTGFSTSPDDSFATNSDSSSSASSDVSSGTNSAVSCITHCERKP